MIKEKKSKNNMTYRLMRLSMEKFNEIEKLLKIKTSNSPIEPKIREATEKDLDCLTNLYNRSWLTSNTPFSRMTSNDWKILYNKPNTIILIAKLFGIDAGFILLNINGPNNKYGVIKGLGILPRFQNKGLGKFLALAAWEHFKQNDVKELKSEIYINNKRSYAFTTSLGFKDYGAIVYDDMGHSYEQFNQVDIF